MGESFVGTHWLRSCFAPVRTRTVARFGDEHRDTFSRVWRFHDKKLNVISVSGEHHSAAVVSNQTVLKETDCEELQPERGWWKRKPARIASEKRKMSKQPRTNFISGGEAIGVNWDTAKLAVNGNDIEKSNNH